MKTASISQIKKELLLLPREEFITICLDLGKYKRENKELISYLLFEKSNEANYIAQLKLEIEKEFTLINTSSYYFIKKSIRKVLRIVKKHIKYSKKKETEVELLIHFCEQLNQLKPSRKNNVTLTNIYERQLILIEKAKSTLHEDLQYDFEDRVEELINY